MLTPDQIKARRKALGLSLDRLAALSGVSWSTLQRLEAGTRNTYQTNIRMIELTLLEAEKGATTAPESPTITGIDILNVGGGYPAFPTVTILKDPTP